MRRIPLLIGALLASMAGARTARASVTIKRQPAVIEHKTFDPAHPPREMPRLNPGEAAVTESLFNCAVSTSYHATEQKGGDDGCSTTVRVDAIQVDVQLKVTIWLPKQAPEKLKAHEEGHRRIAERIYKERAEKAARASASKTDGKRFSGKGKNCDEAVNAALGQADTQLCQSYLNQTGGAVGRLGDIYDQLTTHGTNLKLPEDEAIRQSFEQYDKETAAGKKEDAAL
jgi:hypothetical protein